jgi:hypothetical protein
LNTCVAHYSTDSIPWVHHSREKGSLDYDGGFVRLQIHMNFDTLIYRQQLAAGDAGLHVRLGSCLLQVPLLSPSRAQPRSPFFFLVRPSRSRSTDVVLAAAADLATVSTRSTSSDHTHPCAPMHPSTRACAFTWRSQGPTVGLFAHAGPRRHDVAPSRAESSPPRLFALGERAPGCRLARAHVRTKAAQRSPALATPVVSPSLAALPPWQAAHPRVFARSTSHACAPKRAHAHTCTCAHASGPPTFEPRRVSIAAPPRHRSGHDSNLAALETRP